MMGRGRRRKWKRNCRRMYDRGEHNDFWVVSPAYRSPSSLFWDGLFVFWLSFEGRRTKGSWEL